MSFRVADHPLIAHKLGLLRNHQLSSKDFRDLTREIAILLTCEATRELPTESAEVPAWTGENVKVQRLAGKKLTVVPILRAGLGMLDGVMQVLPNAKVSVVGLARNEETLEPEAYYQNLVPQVSERIAVIVDPMLATGGSLIATIELLKEAGCSKIIGLFLVAAPEGVERVSQTHPDVELVAASMDQKLNDKGYILPGLGDAGDKIFGTQG